MEESDVIQCYCITVKPNDVLLGRGAPIINNEGNVRFRKIVTERKDEYKASCRHQLKNAIAKEIIDEIVQKRKGRFLRVADDVEELKEHGHIPHDAKAAWVVADDVVILHKVKQALREIDDTPTSHTTSSAKKKPRTANSSTTISSTIKSTSKRKRNEGKEEDIDVFIEHNEKSNIEKKLNALCKGRTTTNTLSMKSELPPSQKHLEGGELDTADTITSPTFSPSQHGSNRTKQLETSHKMRPATKNNRSGNIAMNNDWKHQHLLRLDQPNIRSNNLSGTMTEDLIRKTRRIEQPAQQLNLPHQIHMRQSDTMRQFELLNHDLMNINSGMHEDQSNKILYEQNQHMLMSPKVVDESITNNDIKFMHQIDNFQRRMSLITDQSNQMIALKQQGHLDQNSLVSADELFLRRQRLLYVHQEQEQKLMLRQHQLQQQEQQHQMMLQLHHQNYSFQDVVRNPSAWSEDTVPISNTTFLESDLDLSIPQNQQSPSFRNNTHNAYEMLEPRGINAMSQSQYQLQLQQQEYLANLFTSEHVPSSSQEMRFINERNDFTIEQQQSIQQDVMNIQFTNPMNINHDSNYQNYPLYLSQHQDSANERIMLSKESNVTDSYLNHTGMHSLRTYNEDDEIDDEKIAAFKKSV